MTTARAAAANQAVSRTRLAVGVGIIIVLSAAVLWLNLGPFGGKVDDALNEKNAAIARDAGGDTPPPNAEAIEPDPTPPSLDGPVDVRTQRKQELQQKAQQPKAAAPLRGG